MINNELKKALLSNGSFTDIIGQETTKEQLKSALLSERNTIIIGPTAHKMIP